MKCPICDLDLSPLDLVSKTEHVDLCIENGPSVLEIGESGQLVIKKNLPPAKQRKICPICDKTFQKLTQHFKTCALKNDVPPNLMLDYWDKINGDSKNPKKFPREILDSFVSKCVKEGRVGEQVDFARALSLSMAENGDDLEALNCFSTNPAHQNVVVTLPNAPAVSLGATCSPTTNVNLMANVSANQMPKSKPKPKKTFRLELVDESYKKANVELRIERELAATRSKRYRDIVIEAKSLDDGDCMIVSDTNLLSSKQELDKLFHRARLKDCTGSESCLRGDCREHELELIMDGFQVYSGPSMDSTPKRCEPSFSSVEGDEGGSNSRMA